MIDVGDSLLHHRLTKPLNTTENASRVTDGGDREPFGHAQ